MSERIIFSMTGVSKVIPPNRIILKDIYLSFYYGAKIGVLGLNGSGKSTLLKLIAGKDKNYDGKIVFDKDYKIGFLEQEPHLEPGKKVKDVIAEGVQEIVDLVKEYEEINMKFAEPMSDDEMNNLIMKQGELTELLEARDAWNLDHKIERAMDALQCPDPEQLIDNLSGGEARRVALARLLLSQPDILLLDEPTNHLDAVSVAWLEQYLQGFPGTVIAVTHDRYFLDNVAGWILELDRGEGIPWKGNYSSWLEQKSNRLANEEKHESKRRKSLERELEWVRMSPKARQTKSKARLSAYEKLASEDRKEKESKLELYIPPGPRLGDDVIRLENVSKSYGSRKLYDNFSIEIPRNAVVGIIGPNGVGKSTLFRMITGEEQPDSGTVHIGETVKMSYVDQSHEDLKPEKTVYDIISGGHELVQVGNQTLNTRAYISKFNFAGSDQQKKLSVLSGGERNRIHLAMTLKDGGNVLLLDEPTNDIDVTTLRALEEALDAFAGTILIISHDRWFIDRLATHILSFEIDGNPRFFEGNFADYVEQRGDESLVTKSTGRFKNLVVG